MKKQYQNTIKLKRNLLPLGIVFMILGITSLVNKNWILGAILAISSLFSFGAFIYSHYKYLKILTKFKLNCPICGEEVSITTSTKEYSNGVESTNHSKHHDIYLITYYKCLKCHFCYTKIDVIRDKNNKKQHLKTINNVDFNYNNNY